MNRKNFLRKLGIISTGIITASFIFPKFKKEQTKYFLGCDCCDRGNSESHQFIIVRRYDNTTVYFDGKQCNHDFLIDEMAIWKKRLTDEEIKSIYDYYTTALKNNQSISLWA